MVHREEPQCSAPLVQITQYPGNENRIWSFTQLLVIHEIIHYIINNELLLNCYRRYIIWSLIND